MLLGNCVQSHPLRATSCSWINDSAPRKSDNLSHHRSPDSGDWHGVNEGGEMSAETSGLLPSQLQLFGPMVRDRKLFLRLSRSYIR